MASPHNEQFFAGLMKANFALHRPSLLRIMLLNEDYNSKKTHFGFVFAKHVNIWPQEILVILLDHVFVSL
jgi:hypothetical protein